MSEMAAHYDYVTEAWQYMMGGNQHYGYFKNAHEDLNKATNQLIVEMLSCITATHPTMHFLDIGCGTGNAAFFLHTKCKASVTGIAISEKEIDIASERCKLLHLQDAIQFKIVDAQDNKLPDSHFDAAFIIESTLLIPDKPKLFLETFRVLKPGATLVFCDPIKIKSMSPADMYRNGKKLETLLHTFGDTKAETVNFYQTLLHQCGFRDIEIRDITEHVLPTFANWKRNCFKHTAEILQHVSEETLENFINACDILQEFMQKQYLGYAIISAVKP